MYTQAMHTGPKEVTGIDARLEAALELGVLERAHRLAFLLPFDER